MLEGVGARLAMPVQGGLLARLATCREGRWPASRKGFVMASPTHVYMTRVRLKTRKAARRRKNRLHNHGTTPSRAVLFGDVSGADEMPISSPLARQ